MKQFKIIILEIILIKKINAKKEDENKNKIKIFQIIYLKKFII